MTSAFRAGDGPEQSPTSSGQPKSGCILHTRLWKFSLASKSGLDSPDLLFQKKIASDMLLHGVYGGAGDRRIGGQRSDRASGLARQAGEERLEPRLAAGHQDEIVATLCETAVMICMNPPRAISPVGIDAADAPRGAGDEGSALRGGISHALLLCAAQTATPPAAVQSATQFPSRSISSPGCGVNSTMTVRRGTPSRSTQMSTMALPNASRFSVGRPRRNSTSTMVMGSRPSEPR